MFVGLVRDPSGGRGPGDEDAPEPGPPWPRPPWRPFAWFAVWCWLMFLSDVAGGFTGYLLIIAALALAWWRLDRWLARQYWGGLTENKS